MSGPQIGEVVRLHRADPRTDITGVEVLVLCDPSGPVIIHWGEPLGTHAVPEAARAVAELPAFPAAVTWPVGMPVVPASALGCDGRPGLEGSRGDGSGFAPQFQVTNYTLSQREDGAPQLRANGVDEIAELALEVVMTLGHTLEIEAEITNLGATPYRLNALRITVPFPDQAAELLRFSGHWIREFDTERVAWGRGSLTVENRRGRTSHESPPLIFAGQPGFGEWQGSVWGVHLAWSGNHQILADRLPDGRRYMQISELLLPGEISLGQGAKYRSPPVLGVFSAGGLTPATWGFHRAVRARASYPTKSRPVTFNTWEATYFDHDLPRLLALVEAAAQVGVERFVLDDGWFGGRRDDRRGLGDWWVSPQAHPDGLAPLTEAVKRHGMEFGIWVEPEMVNPDSDLYRAHPEWVLADLRREPILSRSQLVLNLAHPDCFAHIFNALDALLRDHEIAFVKWDMNRPLVDPVAADGSAGAHAQTRAVYRLLDELRARHPQVEFESCSSGGGRIDHGILQRTERVWTSDCNDPVERQRIQRGASMLIPPEMMGAHVGPALSHTTGRVHQVGFAGITALFGHFGIEADLLQMSDAQRSELAELIQLHRRLRPLLHFSGLGKSGTSGNDTSGNDTVRFDMEEPWIAHGVYAADRSEAVISCAQLETSPLTAVPSLLCPGLIPQQRYRISTLTTAGLPRWRGQASWERGGDLMTGAQLAVIGVRLPLMNPSSAVVIHLTAVGNG
jgi:alpha-galactosidase